MGRDRVEVDRRFPKQKRKTKHVIANDNGQMSLRLALSQVTPSKTSRSPDTPRRHPDKNLDIFTDSCDGKSIERETMQARFGRFDKLPTPKGKKKRAGKRTNYFFPREQFDVFVHRWEKSGYVLIYHSRDQHTPFLSVVYNHGGNKMIIYFPRDDEDYFAVTI